MEHWMRLRLNYFYKNPLIMNKSIFLLLALVCLIGCGKEDNDFDTKRNNIIGTWDVTQVSQEIRADTVTQETSTTFEIAFYTDGTGTRQIFLDTEQEFEWLYQYNPEKVIIIAAQSGPLLSSVQIHDITKNEPQRQIWESEVVFDGQPVDKYEYTWKMDKK